MRMKRNVVDMSLERKILTHMIVNSQVLERLVDIGLAKYFESPFARVVCGWVWEYWEIAKQAPNRSIEDIFLRKSQGLSDDDREMIQDLLTSISNDWEGSNPGNVDYACDSAESYFKLQALNQLKTRLETCIKSGDVQAGENLISNYIRPDKKTGEAIDMFRDAHIISKAFNDEDEALFMFPGALGEIIGHICREDFIAFLAPMKRGKSWWLMYTAIRAALCGKNVLFINLEMSQNQLIRRFWQCFTGTSKNGETSRVLHFEPDGAKFRLFEQDVKTQKVNSSKASIEKLQRHLRLNTRSGGLRIESFPTKSTTISQMIDRINNLEVYENQVFDVIVVDYADVAKHKGEERHGINDSWERLRGLAQEKHVAVVTASQSGRKTVRGNKDTHADDVSEEVRKLGHVTKLMVINATDEEKEAGICRIGVPLQREGKAFSGNVIVLQNLDIGRPYLDSRMEHQVDMGNDE